MSNDYTRPQSPFLLIYVNGDDEISYVWGDTETEIRNIIEEIKNEGCNIINAIEINACRDIFRKD